MIFSGTTTRLFCDHEKDVMSVAFSADNRQIVSGSRDKSIKLWNTLGVCKYTIQVRYTYTVVVCSSEKLLGFQWRILNWLIYGLTSFVTVDCEGYTFYFYSFKIFIQSTQKTHDEIELLYPNFFRMRVTPTGLHVCDFLPTQPTQSSCHVGGTRWLRYGLTLSQLLFCTFSF